jgi:hypothetical protein
MQFRLAPQTPGAPVTHHAKHVFKSCSGRRVLGIAEFPASALDCAQSVRSKRNGVIPVKIILRFGQAMSKMLHLPQMKDTKSP